MVYWTEFAWIVCDPDYMGRKYYRAELRELGHSWSLHTPHGGKKDNIGWFCVEAPG